MEQSNKIDTSSLTKWIPIVPGFLIFVGLIKAMAFYAYFNIDILEFISLGEAILISVGDIAILLLLWVPIVGLSRLLPKSVMATIIVGSEEKEKLSMKKFVLEAGRRTAMLWIAMFVVIFSRLIITIQTNTIYQWNSFIILTVALSVSAIIFFLLIAAIYKLQTANQAIILLVLFIVLWISVFILTNTYFRANTLKNDLSKPSTGLIILKDSSYLNLSNQVIYIGKVQDYTFVYDRYKEEATAIKNDNVKHYKFLKQKKSGGEAGGNR